MIDWRLWHKKGGIYIYRNKSKNKIMVIYDPPKSSIYEEQEFDLKEQTK